MIHIKFTNGSRSYILWNESFLYKWFNIYTITPHRYKNGILYVTADERAKKASYSERKEAARLFAIDTQKRHKRKRPILWRNRRHSKYFAPVRQALWLSP